MSASAALEASSVPLAQPTTAQVDKAWQWFVAATAVLATGVYIANSYFGWGWIAASILAAVLDIGLIWHIWAWKDGLSARLAIIGLVGGGVILLTDWYCITYAGLRYVQEGPFLLYSPAYMLFSAVPAAVQLCQTSLTVDRKWGLTAAVLVTALMGAVYIPLYEYWAKAGNLWTYHGTSMFFDTVPHYIVFGEVFIALAASLVTRLTEHRSIWWAVPLGLAYGFINMFGIVLGHKLLP